MELLHHLAGVAAHVTIGRSLLVDGFAQLQALLDGGGAHVEDFLELQGNLCVTHVDTARAIGIDIEAHGLSLTDGVGYLHQHLAGDAGSDGILGDVTCGVSSTAVHLARVLAAEGTATMCAMTAIGVDDDLAARQTGVAGRTADDKLARGIHMQFELVVKQGLDVL